MSDERYTFEQARIRLEEIATLVRKKDTSLEKSLDLLEEGVRLANICTELVDHTDLSATAEIEPVPEAAEVSGADEVAEAEEEPAPLGEADAEAADDEPDDDEADAGA